MFRIIVLIGILLASTAEKMVCGTEAQKYVPVVFLNQAGELYVPAGLSPAAIYALQGSRNPWVAKGTMTLKLQSLLREDEPGYVEAYRKAENEWRYSIAPILCHAGCITVSILKRLNISNVSASPHYWLEEQARIKEQTSCFNTCMRIPPAKVASSFYGLPTHLQALVGMVYGEKNDKYYSKHRVKKYLIENNTSVGKSLICDLRLGVRGGDSELEQVNRITQGQLHRGSRFFIDRNAQEALVNEGLIKCYKKAGSIESQDDEFCVSRKLQQNNQLVPLK